jgi:hypothetical protein
VKAAGQSAGLTVAEFDSIRGLLESPKTWRALGQGTVEDLAHRIASCLPPRPGRTAEDSHAAALTIARGLLEFAVSDLDPKVFQQVLLARLQRMETNQGNALDEALLHLHADLAARFTSVMELFKRVLDGLPPGPADRCETAWYLKTLIDWLNSDPWPQHRQFGGPLLTPAAIERKLRVTAGRWRPSGTVVSAGPGSSLVRGRRSAGSDGHAGRHARENNLDADELVQRCHGLVILGGSGSGKTWLARRTARRYAEEALRALATGATLDEIELPLYTTCSHLFNAPGDIRQAVVSSALDQLGDLGGSRLNVALRAFFTERNAPTVLVIDSLDEAHGSDERLRQADTLPWRIVLTSRPVAWNYQLVIDDEDDSHQVGELQPLRYPDDVEPFIRRWFDQRPEWGSVLAAQIARRPDLQRAATVPLILAFYCIVGADQPLPALRRDLYTLVLRRMLTGRWRGSNPSDPDHDVCLRTLRAWAWSGATSDPVSGVGTWTDDIPTDRFQLSKADSNALDHIATPLGPPDLDTGKTLRRFIHRSVREHLVAEYVAGLPLDQAAATLLPHLWYDSDWEYSAPAALAMHDQRDQLILCLINAAAGSDHVPENLSVIDAGWEFRRFLARVAAESSETNWSPDAVAIIGRTRVELARGGRISDLGGSMSWGSSNRETRQALLGLLAGQADAEVGLQLADTVARLDPVAEDKRQVREALLGLLAGQTMQLADTVTRIYQSYRSAAPETASWKDWRDKELEVLAAHQTHAWVAARLADALARLDPAAEDIPQAREALLALLADQTSAEGAAQLADALARLDPTAEDKRQAREALLALLAGQPEALLGMLASQELEVLLGLISSQTITDGATQLADAVGRLDPTAEDRRQTRQALLKLLATSVDDRRGLITNQTDAAVAIQLADAVAELDPTAEDRHRTRAALFGLLAHPASSEVATFRPGLRPGGMAPAGQSG